MHGSKHMNIIRQRPNLAIIVLSIVGLSLFLILTNPNEVAIGLLVLPVIFFFLIAYNSYLLIADWLKPAGRTSSKRKLAAIMAATFGTMVVILQSTGGISIADLILLILIGLLATVYVKKF